MQSARFSAILCSNPIKVNSLLRIIIIIIIIHLRVGSGRVKRRDGIGRNPFKRTRRTPELIKTRNGIAINYGEIMIYGASPSLTVSLTGRTVGTVDFTHRSHFVLLHILPKTDFLALPFVFYHSTLLNSLVSPIEKQKFVFDEFSLVLTVRKRKRKKLCTRNFFSDRDPVPRSSSIPC